MKKIIIGICLLIHTNFLCSQCIVDAQELKTICWSFNHLDTIELEAIVPSGAIPPLTFHWEVSHELFPSVILTASDFLDDINSQTPTIISSGGVFSSPLVNFFLTITDSTGVICKDSTLVLFSLLESQGNTNREITNGDSILFDGFRLDVVHPPLTCLWEPNYNLSDIDDCNPTFWPEKDTVYHVSIKDSVGCQIDLSLFFAVRTSSIIENDNNSNIEIYPNPSSGKFSIVRKNYFSDGRIQILSIDGSITSDMKLPKQELMEIDLTHLSKGIHWLIYYQDNEVVNYEKIVID